MNAITEMIKKLNELNETGAIGHSTWKELIILAREIQTEVSVQ